MTVSKFQIIKWRRNLNDFYFKPEKYYNGLSFLPLRFYRVQWFLKKHDYFYKGRFNSKFKRRLKRRFK